MSRQTKYPDTTRWQMKRDCVFVDSYLNKKDLSVAERLPREILPYAHVMDRLEEAEKDRQVVLLNDLAAFIMRFIALGVDTDKHLPDIVHSEYGGSLPMAEIKTAIDAIEEQMVAANYIEPRQTTKIPQAAPEMDQFEVKQKNYDLDAGIHSIGPTIIRLPR